MNFFKKLFARPAAAPVPAPAPAPNWLEVDGQIVDLNTYSPAQLAQLETDLVARRQQRESELADYLLNLAAERERLLATRDASLWVLTLKLMFGEVLGRRVAIQDIGPGMQLQHLVLSFGQPDHVEARPTGLALLYGSPPEVSYFELDGATIVKAVVGLRPALPF
ncbi:MAG TPA: hypothetical protein VFO93_08325 [Hymenobacter sp.]|uniref:hypothetical protein n=1 Tax=Hymenobacter sp. TaxID=1898978 RepID=UPI002D8004E0|nr:hypothetical protein [Hymenobacter sp.]HET9503533.1 hypothetical protein [Hymenobacter sp.]